METIQKDKKLIWPMLAVSLVSFLLAAVACELVLEYRYNKDQERVSKRVAPFYSWTFYTAGEKRVSTRKGPLGLMLHPKIGYVNFPDQQHDHFTINSQGFRGSEITPKQEGVKRVVLVGGSTAFGTGLQSDDETFASQVSTMIDDIEVINAAVIGHRSGQELNYVVNDLVDLEPDLIIAINGFNDYISRNDHRWIDMNGATQVEGQLESLNGYVYSGFFKRIPHMLEIPFVRTRSTIERAVNQFRPASSQQQSEEVAAEILTKSIDTYSKNVWKSYQISDTFSARFLCVLQPSKSLLEKGDDGTYTTFRNGVKTNLQNHGIPFLDLNDYIDDFTVDMFMDELHLDVRGNEVMASIIAEALQQEGLLDNQFLAEVTN